MTRTNLISGLAQSSGFGPGAGASSRELRRGKSFPCEGPGGSEGSGNLGERATSRGSDEHQGAIRLSPTCDILGSSDGDKVNVKATGSILTANSWSNGYAEKVTDCPRLRSNRQLKAHRRAECKNHKAGFPDFRLDAKSGAVAGLSRARAGSRAVDGEAALSTDGVESAPST